MNKVENKDPKSIKLWGEILKTRLETGEPCSPTFREALDTQKVCQAVYDSAKSKSWKDCNIS